MLSDTLRWAFYSRQRLLVAVGAVVLAMVALAVLNGSGGDAAEPAKAKPKASPTATDPGAWLQPSETPTPTPSPTVTVTTTEDLVLAAAEDFAAVFVDRSIVPERWRAEVAERATPELAAAMETADPTRVPVLSGKPTLRLDGLSDVQATVTATYQDGGLRLTLTTDGEAWLVANVLPVE